MDLRDTLSHIWRPLMLVRDFRKLFADMDFSLLQWQGVTKPGHDRCAVDVFVYLHPDQTSKSSADQTHCLIECARVEGDVGLFYLFFRDLCLRLTHCGEGRTPLCRKEELEVIRG